MIITTSTTLDSKSYLFNKESMHKACGSDLRPTYKDKNH